MTMSRAKESPTFPPTDCLMIPIQNNRSSTTTKRTCHEPTAVKPSPRRVAVLLTSPYRWGGGPSGHRTRTDSGFNVMSPCALAESRSKKPECSYAVLIGIAMRAAQAANRGNRLPVIDIYRFIEKEFPYFKNCKSSGWKNCVRHCLSLGQFFRKVERCAESVAIKGNYWEVIPEKRPLLNRDIEVFVLEEHKKFLQRHKKFNALVTKNSNNDLRVASSPSHPPTSHPPPSHPSTPHLSIPHSPSSHPPTPHQHSSHLHQPPSTHPPTNPCVLAQLQQSNSHQTPSTMKDTTSEVCGEDLSPFTTPDQEATQNGLTVNDTVAESDLAPLPHVPNVLCPHSKTTTVLCDCSTSIDEEDPLPCRSTEAQYTKNHIHSDDDNTQNDSFSVTGSEVEKQTDYCSSGMYVFPGVVPPLSSSTHSNFNTQNSNNLAGPSRSGNESGEKEESPLINPNHPVVNNNTLASINGVLSVPDPGDVPEFVTTSAATCTSYVMAPHQMTDTSSHSSPSKTFVSKMSHSIFYSFPNSIRKHNHITLHQSLLSPPQFHRRTHAQLKEKCIPPYVRPLSTHMNDPSHFLPSNHFYSTPPYRGRYVHSDTICSSGYGKGDGRSLRRSDAHSDLKTRNGNSNQGKNVGTKMGQAPPILPHPHRRFAPKPQSQREESSNCYQQTLTDDSLTEHPHQDSINHQLDMAIDGTNGQQFFEVPTDWIKLTIAREEEVESSIL